MTRLEVNHRTINFKNRILQLRTITAVAKLNGVRPLPFRWRTIAIVAFVSIMGLASTGENGQLAPGLLVGLSGVSFVAYAVWKNLQPRNYWILHVETAAGSSNLLASSDERAIDDGVRAITLAMEADVSFHQSIIINDSTIISDSVVKGSVIHGMAQSNP
jgi:hypothetical protein